MTSSASLSDFGIQALIFMIILVGGIIIGLIYHDYMINGRTEHEKYCDKLKEDVDMGTAYLNAYNQNCSK